VEEVRAVRVHLDTGLGFDLAVRVTAEVGSPLEDEDVEVELVGAPFGDGETEEPRADDDEVGLGQGRNS
jgi:hypothetical protein